MTIGGAGATRIVPVLFGLALAGCPDGKDDTASGSNTFDSQAAYGVPETDWTVSDSNPTTTEPTTEGSSSSDGSSSGGSESSDGSESSSGTSSESDGTESGSSGADSTG